MGFRTKKSRETTEEEQQVGEQEQEEEQTSTNNDEKKDKNKKDKVTEETLPELPSYMKLPFGRFKGLSRHNTVLGTQGLPYAWGYTYVTPYRYGYVKKRADFESAKFEFDYMATSLLRGIRQMKHEVSMFKFFENPIFNRRQRAIQPLD